MAAQGSDDRIGLMMQMMANLQESMQKQVEKVDNLQESMQKQVEKVDNLEESMQKQVEKVDNLQESMQKQVEKVDNLQESMQKQVEKVDNLQESMQKQVEKVVDLQKQVQNLQQDQDSMSKDINTFVTPLYRMHPVPEDVVSQLTDKTFHETAKKYYGGTDSCVVLRQLFSSEDGAPWYASHWYPAVAGHIVPKAQWTVAEIWGFHTTDAKNALLLLKDVELKYQAGRLTLIPAEVERAKDELIKVLKFGELDGKEISVRPPPHMRALFLKAEMAHRQHEELTNPFMIVDRYTQRCQSMAQDLIRRLLESNSLVPA